MNDQQVSPPLTSPPPTLETVEGRDLRPILGALVLILIGMGIAIGVIGGPYIVRMFRGDIRQRASGGVAEVSQPEPVLQTLPTLAKLDEQSAEVSGLVCAHGDHQVAGTVKFYNYDQKTLYQKSMGETESSYTVILPVGRYLAFFKPTGIWPAYAHTAYVACGSFPNECTDHSVLLLTAEAGKSYGKTHICDPQFKNPTRFTTILNAK